jgi:aminomethyltransferase
MAKLVPGAAQYSVMCLPSGGIVDDVIYYRLRDDRVLFCVNASNEEKDFQWIRDHASGAEVRNRSADFAQLALQGPSAERILQRLTSIDLCALRPFFAVEGEFGGAAALVSRTGYTGEDGFELYVAPERAEALWDRPLEAGLGWVVKIDKGEFVGREALVQQRAEGLRRRLVGLGMDASAAPPRHGYAVHRDGRPVGVVTSGTKSPTLGRGIALALVERAAAEIGTRLEVEIRSRQHPAEVVPLPFVRGQK